MTIFEMTFAVLITPVSALLIAWWVLRDNRKMGEAARRRTEAMKSEG